MYTGVLLIARRKCVVRTARGDTSPIHAIVRPGCSCAQYRYDCRPITAPGGGAGRTAIRWLANAFWHSCRRMNAYAPVRLPRRGDQSFVALSDVPRTPVVQPIGPSLTLFFPPKACPTRAVPVSCGIIAAVGSDIRRSRTFTKRRVEERCSVFCPTPLC